MTEIGHVDCEFATGETSEPAVLEFVKRVFKAGGR